MKLAMTLKETAYSLSMAETTIRKMVKLDQFPKPYKVGITLRFDVDDLKTWQLEQKQVVAKKKTGRPRLAV